jgi:hypothetical protein
LIKIYARNSKKTAPYWFNGAVFFAIFNLFQTKNNKKMLPNKYFTAIFFNAQKKAFKYRNIKNDTRSLEAFTVFALSKNAIEINFYCTATKNFSHKVFLQR